MRLESGYGEVVQQEERTQSPKMIKEPAEEFIKKYRAKHRAPVFAVYALGHVERLPGAHLILEVTPGILPPRLQ